jgi:hypothetical protein
MPGCPGSADEQSFAYQASDGRVEGNGGDLIVLYCQPKDRSVSVYGIVNGSGVPLATFATDRVRAAGPAGLTVDLRQQGSVSVYLASDKHFIVALKGGLVAAAGLANYVKVFECGF